MAERKRTVHITVLPPGSKAASELAGLAVSTRRFEGISDLPEIVQDPHEAEDHAKAAHQAARDAEEILRLHDDAPGTGKERLLLEACRSTLRACVEMESARARSLKGLRRSTTIAVETAQRRVLAAVGAALEQLAFLDARRPQNAPLPAAPRAILKSRILKAMRDEYRQVEREQEAWLERPVPKDARPRSGVANHVADRVAAAVGSSRSTVLRAWNDFLGHAEKHSARDRERSSFAEIALRIERNASVIRQRIAAAERKPKAAGKKGKGSASNISRRGLG